MGEGRAALVWAALAENSADVEQFHLFADPSGFDVGLFDVPEPVGMTDGVDQCVLFQRVVSARPTHDVANDAEAAPAVAVTHPVGSAGRGSGADAPVRLGCAAQHQ